MESSVILISILGYSIIPAELRSTTYQKIIDNKRPSESTKEWHKIIESVSISDQISENNQKFSHDTPFSTIIQEDEIIYTKHPADDKNGPNSHINSNSLNTVRE
ncbi:hypothetical protein C1646_772224 [Rhizophagus diaphanus]|nr:hypothetical protein C1646_772224 [Rhizophagus diaphanus] [Rhizophagus sp. MUCL 43196]